MTPLPSPLGSGALMLWRIDDARYASAWRAGTGASRFGGRWNRIGTAAVYAALDPATAILEVAVHKGFRVLDQLPHILTSAVVSDLDAIKVIQPADVPDPGWLDPRQTADGPPQEYGDALLRQFGVIVIPSTVSRHSWNLVMAGDLLLSLTDIRQQPLIVDPRLHATAG